MSQKMRSILRLVSLLVLVSVGGLTTGCGQQYPYSYGTTGYNSGYGTGGYGGYNTGYGGYNNGYNTGYGGGYNTGYGGGYNTGYPYSH